MSDQADRETIGDDLGVWSVDAEDQLQPEDTLDGAGDVLDRGFIAADHAHGSTAYGIRASEQAREETIDQRVRQEERDPLSLVADQDGRGGSEADEDDGFTTGEDAESVRAGLAAVRPAFAARVGRIIAPDEGSVSDTEAMMVAREGSPTSWDAPEEAAMHYLSDDDYSDDY